MARWKRGLLKAWLALSLLWAAVVIVWAINGALTVSAGIEGSGLLVALIVIYVLPVFALPWLLVLFFGWAAIRTVERLSRRRRSCISEP
ncbi:hypothetical protein HKCCE4037_14870 [Rhodobacterales bacterium HKCCE4037]|nr:hypothetical protein [Rhodobacterales bacterium HKCCE4037]